MSKIILGTALVSALLAGVSTSPTPRLTKRFEEGVDCTWDNVDAKPGLFFAVGSDGTNLSCDDAAEATSSAGVACYITTDDPDKLGDHVKCPGDPAPKKNPDGSDAESIGDGLMNTWCSLGGGNIALDFANIVGCLVYGYYEAEGDPIKEAETGAMGICNTIFAGACTWFFEIAPSIAEGMDRPCVDDPGSNACAFAGPGKKS